MSEALPAALPAADVLAALLTTSLIGVMVFAPYMRPARMPVASWWT